MNYIKSLSIQITEFTHRYKAINALLFIIPQSPEDLHFTFRNMYYYDPGKVIPITYAEKALFLNYFDSFKDIPLKV